MVGGANVSERALRETCGRAVIRIVPVIGGAKSAWGKILIGVVLLVAAWATGGTALVWAQPFLAGAGASLVLQGATQFLTEYDNKPADPERFQSGTFDGAPNLVGQGHPVPILLGELFIGSVVVSASIEVEEWV